MPKPIQPNLNEFSEASMISTPSLMPTPTFSEATTKDEFASTQFLDPNARLPRIQALRSMNSDLQRFLIE